MTLTDTYRDKLSKMKRGAKLDLKASECSVAAIRAYYRAAKKHGMKVTIKNSPDGMRLWRLA